MTLQEIQYLVKMNVPYISQPMMSFFTKVSNGLISWSSDPRVLTYVHIDAVKQTRILMPVKIIAGHSLVTFMVLMVDGLSNGNKPVFLFLYIYFYCIHDRSSCQAISNERVMILE